MKILMAAAEMAPFIRSGDLADAVSDLSGELRGLGHEVSVVLPFYRSIREDKAAKFKKTKIRFSVQVGSSRLPCEIYEAKAPNGVKVYFVARDEYFDRSGIYGVEGRDYQDNAARFIYFTKCVLELAKGMEEPPDILHLNSWETALAPVFVRDQRLPFRTVLTPHSLEFQGNFWSYDFALTNLPGDYFSARGVEYFGSMNCLKAGILFSDAVVFSSERSVCAVQTPDYGCGLDSVLREHQQKLSGILSGTGVGNWSPSNDEALASTYSAAKPGNRGKNRPALLKALGLEEGGTVFITFTEASNGRGLDSLLASLDHMLTDEVRLIVFGAVGEEHTVPLEVARRKHAGRFVHREAVDEKTARLALAGSDVLLIPGAVEPSATWLRRAQRYGTVPLALQCGGLFQYVRDWEPAKGLGNGFVYYAPGVGGLVDATRRAAKVLSDEEQRADLVGRLLRVDYSGEALARGHEALYERLLGIQKSSRAA